MVNATHQSFRADDRSYFSILKKEIHKQAHDEGYSDKRIAELDIIISELTSNLHKHAVDGEVLFANIKSEAGDYLEIITIDNGPGINDVSRMMADGMSTTNTLGQGLGSIKRLSDTFDIYSQKDWGTITLNRLLKEAKKQRNPLMYEIHALVVAKPGETLSGDGTYYKVTQEYFKILIADGLGHGPEANKAVNEAVNAFKICPFHSPVEVLRYIDSSIKRTRGMVGTVIIYNRKTNIWSVAGVGNISCKFANGLSYKNIMSYNGIIGHNIPRTMHDQEIALADFPHFIACSDGLKSKWESAKYPLIGRCDPSILAAAIYKDFARKTDDMSVVIGKVKK
ncbi:serine/threonine protein kinase [Desertivirga arenae]|uniref:serine/threonine protein kinase n=1 Tax=Desertivirga arenae TaxID=2810309 RepID=UPI001A96FF25|nr:serine/threonine protein kinase [Pedobacter sp. SYSU D00823]